MRQTVAAWSSLRTGRGNRRDPTVSH